jgi:NAD(P)-dependent dehydrogenase (short-subunit alcohol dehydrogenase family)
LTIQLVNFHEESTMSKVWLITGSSRGLGRAFADAVAAAGDQLVATARDPERLTDLVDRYPGQVGAIALDVTDPAAALAAVQAAVDTFGRLDVVVNNAGYANLSPIEQASDEDLRAQIETNLFGVINVTRAALPVLRQQRSGHFIQVSTVGGRRAGGPGLGAYSTSKFGVEGFSEVLSLEVAPFGVKVTIIEPGGFRTDWAGSSMSVTRPIPDYQPTVGAWIDRLGGLETRADGDPERAAQIILQVAAMDNPPLRLPLGNNAVDLIREADHAELAEIDRWESLSRSADRPPAAVDIPADQR